MSSSSCDNDPTLADQYMSMRIASILVLLVVSALGAFAPLVVGNTRLKSSALILYLTKHFGSGVILGTAFVHLLGEAQENLGSSCLTGGWEEYPWASAICLMGAFTMFSIELFVLQLLNWKQRNIRIRSDDSESSIDFEQQASRSAKAGPSYNSGVELVISECSCDSPTEDLDPTEAPIKKIMNICLLEFGIVFHSIFVGLSLAISQDEFKTLFVAISFHQFFEGLGLASRFATTVWPENMKMIPWIFSAIFSLITPVGVAVGLGVRHLYLENSIASLIVVGVFDSLCAGILIYNCLVELMAHDFLHDLQIQTAPIKKVMLGYVMLVLGCGLMSLLAKWA